MLDLDGRVVGISTAIRANSNNIGFAIPIDMASELLPALVSQGRIRRSALGIMVDPVSVLEMKRLGVPNATGALVRAVQPGGPAEQAGIRVDDIVVEFDGKPLGKPGLLQWLTSRAGVGHVAAIRLLRQNRSIEVKATLTELADKSEVLTAGEHD